MDWEMERYVRLYTRDTAAWIMWRWEARALLPLLMRKLDRTGRTPVDRHGIKGIAALVGLPVEVTKAGLKELVEDGCLVLERDAIMMPNFAAGQSAKQSAAVRKAEQREREKLETFPSGAGKDQMSRDVTRRDSCHSSLAEPSLAELILDPPLPPAAAGGISPLVLVPADAEEQDASGPLAQLALLQDADPDRVTPESLVTMWNEVTGGRIAKVEPDRRAAVRKAIARQPSLDFWSSCFAKAAAVKTTEGTGWLSFDWIFGKSSRGLGWNAERMAGGAFDFKVEAGASRPHRHDGLERIDPPKRQRRQGEQSVHRCAVCPDILPHTWSGTDWTPDPHTCAEGAMETI